MKDIGIWMSDEVLKHKKRDGKSIDNRYCYWTMRVPKGVSSGDLLWVANHGKWIGHFVIFDYSEDEIDFHSDSWVDDIRGERSLFRGFTYKVPIRNMKGEYCV